MGSFHILGHCRIVPIGLVLSLVGCATANQSMSGRDPGSGQCRFSRLINPSQPKQETTATIVALPEPGQALPPKPSNELRAQAGSALTGDPSSATSEAGGPGGSTRSTQPTVSEKLGRLFPLFNRSSTVHLPIPPRPPLPNTEALNALANQPKGTLGEADMWATSTRTRALALLEGDRAKARIKPRSDPRTGTTGVLAAREARPPYELVANEESVLPVSLEINTNASRERAAIAKPAANRSTQAVANSALRRASEPRPDPWAPYPNSAAMNAAKSSVVLGAPTTELATSATTATQTETPSVEPQPRPEPVLADSATSKADSAEPVTPPSTTEDPSPSPSETPVAETPAEAPPPVTTAPVDTPRASDTAPVEEHLVTTNSPLVPESQPAVEPPPAAPMAESVESSPVAESPAAEPALPAQEPETLAETPQEMPPAVLSDRVEFPEDSDARVEAPALPKVEVETSRVSLADVPPDPKMTTPNDFPALPPTPAMDAQAPKPALDPKNAPKATSPDPTKAATPPATVENSAKELPKATTPEPAKVSTPPATKPATENPAKEPSVADTPPVPSPASDPEPNKPSETERTTPEKPSAKATEPADEPKPAVDPNPAVETTSTPSTQTALPTPPAAPSKRSGFPIDFPRWTHKANSAKAQPSAPSKVRPEAVAPDFSAPSKGAPAAAAVNSHSQKQPAAVSPTRQAPTKALPAAVSQAESERVPIWTPYNNLGSTDPIGRVEVPTKSRPSESPTAGWKIPPMKPTPGPSGSIANSRRVTSSPQVATAPTGTPSILSNRERVVGRYDFNEMFPATYQGAMTRVTPLSHAAAPGRPPVSVESTAYSTSAGAPAKRKSILSRFLARFQRDDTPVPTPADAIAGRVNPQGVWKDSAVGSARSSIASVPSDVPQRGDAIQRVSADGINKTPQR